MSEFEDYVARLIVADCRRQMERSRRLKRARRKRISARGWA